MKLRLNVDKIVRVAAQGHISPPIAFGVEVTHDGQAKQVPGVGGIVYYPRIGDTVFGYEGDHIEPGVSTAFGTEKSGRPNASYNFLCCAGNDALVISGAAKGKMGTVIGHHGGVENVMIDFPQSVLEKLTYDDKILVRAHGQGLKLLDAPDVTVMNCDPRLLEKLIQKLHRGVAEVPVAAVVPAEMMGSGIGSTSARTGDYDIMTSDPSLNKKHKIGGLRFGDIIGIEDHHADWGWTLKKGARSIGVVIHSDSLLAGHGPGTTTLLTSALGRIRFRISPRANIGAYLKLGRFRKSK